MRVAVGGEWPDHPVLVSMRIARKALGLPRSVLRRVLPLFAKFDFVEKTRSTQTPITIDMWIDQHILGHHADVYWPVHRTSTVIGWRNILAGVETSPGYMGGCYIQALGTICIGDYSQIGPNVGLISSNHNLLDNHRHTIGHIRIGAYCWIGMGVVVLPDVELGDFTIVGANAVVTKSFPEGYCVVAGNPARVIRRLDPDQCVRSVSEHEYHGYVPKAEFEEFRRRNLNV